MTTVSTRPRVAFLGLGLMGGGMAHRLAAAGFPISVYNRNPAKAGPLEAAGAIARPTARAAAEGADFVVSMVADDAAAREVWLGEQGALAGVARGALILESSTVSLGWIRELASEAAARGCDCLDAPVTGSRPQAAAGQLNFLVGGSAANVGRARPLFEAMGKSVTHLGPVGSGALVKLINNFACGVQIASIAEALAMLERFDIDRDKALEVLTNGAPGSPLVKVVSGRMAASDYTPNFLLRLIAKDLTYALSEAAQRGLALKTAQAALGLFQDGIAAGFGDRDMASVIEPLRRSKDDPS
jgi:3-hydroxyisobutyrate dehydrogenase